MAVNADKPDRWKLDVRQSVDMYNEWFIQFAPKAYRDTRIETTKRVEQALEWTKNLTNIEAHVLREHPTILSMLRMTTAPPIARDRLIGLSGVEPNLVESMEIRRQIPPKMVAAKVDIGLQKIGQTIMQLADTNKRKKEEATKMAQLQRQHGKVVRFVLFLCGYFDTSYLGYEAAEGIDWVWEHRINDLEEFGV